MITAQPEPRALAIQMRGILDARENPSHSRATADNMVINRANVDRATSELVTAARTMVRVAFYKTDAWKMLKDKLDKYDKATGGGDS